MATTNQIAYWKMMNEDRHYRAQEAETHRSNVAQESETTRANLARESETARNNRVNNLIAYGTLEEQKRSNLSKEAETERSNRAREAETFRSNRVREQETEIHNQHNEWIDENRIAQRYWMGLGAPGIIAGQSGFAIDQAWNNPRKRQNTVTTPNSGGSTSHLNPNSGVVHGGQGGKF